MTVIKGNHDRMFDYFMQSRPAMIPVFAYDIIGFTRL